MKVIYTGRHVEVSDALRVSAEEGLTKMQAYLDDIIDVHVIFSVEKHRHMAEINLKTSDGEFIASAESTDMYQSLSQALDKLETQAHKHAGTRMAGFKEKPLVELAAEAEGSIWIQVEKSPGARPGFFVRPLNGCPGWISRRRSGESAGRTSRHRPPPSGRCPSPRPAPPPSRCPG